MTDPAMIEAAEWAEQLDRDCDGTTRTRFDDWHARPGHAAAWAAVSDARATSATLADHPDMLVLRHAAVARAALGREPPRVAPWMLAAAACAAVVAPLTLWRFADDAPAARIAETPVYRTATGQRLMVTLTDGSRLTLDTDSRVRMAYTASERRLVLERGQALFEVAKHQRRPFVVTAGAQSVTAHGTAFDVRFDPHAVQVALVEGLVSVATKGVHGKPVAMVPDDVLTASVGGVSVQHIPGRALALSSWSEGRLVFEDETLRQAVAEMNRYGAPQIVITDAEAGRLRISGAFRTGEVQPFLDALEMGFPVTVDRHANGGITIASKK
ncbi:FecR domain-containing protein [Sphingomonas sp. CFBP 13728]|uniref:FecR domain-containing protein n=1 Tax=Sphingomonas sp. CFBP 13728 TaxID=2775294 RepID=UPI00177F1585|nr:FecR domain-containing protein [Sphingomonas sp. CFBP 13728]